MPQKDYIKRNIESILKKLEKKGTNTQLMAVTKTVSVEFIEEAIGSGIFILGESRIQEALPKITELNLKHKGLRWHFIGTLQANKVNKTVDSFEMIQSVDTMKLAQKISAVFERERKKIDILLEVKVSEEKTKHGIQPEQVPEIISSLKNSNSVNVRGLMAMAPYSDDPGDSAPYFRKAREVFEEIKKESGSIDTLSMGMTHDYEAAVDEGSTMVRIGSGIFGERQY